MEENKTITVSTGEIEFPANWDENDDGTSYRKAFTVTIDDKTSGGGFRYDTNNDWWFDYFVVDNKFTIIAKQNFNVSERVGYIILHHNQIQGEDGEVVVVITQKGIECDIKVDGAPEKTINFTPVYPVEDTEVIVEDTKVINVTVTGGNKKFFIKSFKEYGSDGRVIKNDKGVKVTKNDVDSTVSISSYGRVFSTNGQYYEIVLAHDEDSAKTATIKVTYDNVDIKNDIPTPSTRNALRKGHTAKIENKPIPTFVELMGLNDFEEPSLVIYGLNAPIPGKRKKKLSNEILFERGGGSQEYAMEVTPSNAVVSVTLGSDFVSYKIENNVLILTVKPNYSPYYRKCMIQIHNSVNPFDKIVKYVKQKGTED